MKKIFPQILFLMLLFAFSSQAIVSFSKTFTDMSFSWSDTFDVQKGSEETEDNENQDIDDKLYASKQFFCQTNPFQLAINNQSLAHNKAFLSSNYQQEIFSPPENI